jgi:hypothetical protein
MPKNTKKRKRNNVRRRTYKKIGGNPRPNNIKKIIQDEFAQSFTLAGDIGHSPTAPLEQAKRTLLLREKQKQKNKGEKKSKVTGIQTRKKSGNTLASAISQGYSAGVGAASLVQSRGKQFSNTIGSAIGQRIPTGMSNMQGAFKQLFPQGTTRKTSASGKRGTRTSTGTTGTGTGTGKGTTGGPPLPPSLGKVDTVQSTGNTPPPPPSLKGINFNSCPVCGNNVSDEVTMDEFLSKFKEFMEQKSDNLQNQDELSKLKNNMASTISTETSKINTIFNNKNAKLGEAREEAEASKEKKREERAKKLARKKGTIKKQCTAISNLEDNNPNFEKEIKELLKKMENNGNNNSNNK